MVILVDGDLVLYVERGGRTLLTFTDTPTAWPGRPTCPPWPSATAPSAASRSRRPTADRVRHPAGPGPDRGRVPPHRPRPPPPGLGSTPMPEGDTVSWPPPAWRPGRPAAGRHRLPRPPVRHRRPQRPGRPRVAARGKHLLLRTNAGTTLHTHFKMEGAWHLYRPRALARPRLPGPGRPPHRAVGRGRVPPGHLRAAPHRQRTGGRRPPRPRTSSAPTGTRPRPCAASAPTPTGPSAPPCSTSAPSPAPATSTSPRSASSAASTPGPRSARSRTWRPWSTCSSA